MPVLGNARTAARIRILVFAAAALCLVLLWGCWLVFGARVGTSICENYTGTAMNPFLSQWCAGNSWRGWLGSCLAIATALLTAGVGVAMATSQVAWLIPGTLLSAVAVWVGFALPQEVVGGNIGATPPNSPPVPYQQPTTPTVAPGPPLLDRAAPSVLPSAHPRGLAHDIVPAPLFACPRDAGPVEFAAGPGAMTNFDTVRVQRGPRGLCATFTSPAIASFALQQDESRVVSLVFTPTGEANPQTFSVEVWAADQGARSLILRPDHGVAQATTIGNLGLAHGHLSILVDEPRLPRWIVDRHSQWSAHLT